MRSSVKLQAAAQAHADDMATNDYYGHQSRDGTSQSDRIRMQGYQSRMTAENIAAGQQSPEEVIDSWLRSPGHCRNILNAELTEIGIGVAVNLASDKGVYWVQNFGSGER